MYEDPSARILRLLDWSPQCGTCLCHISFSGTIEEYDTIAVQESTTVLLLLLEAPTAAAVPKRAWLRRRRVRDLVHAVPGDGVDDPLLASWCHP